MAGSYPSARYSFRYIFNDLIAMPVLTAETEAPLHIICLVNKTTKSETRVENNYMK